MANHKKLYPLPDYKSTTPNIDEYVAAWRSMAKPIERELGLTLNGFDPTFIFIKGSPQQSMSATVNLPVWFVRDLAATLNMQNHEQLA